MSNAIKYSLSFVDKTIGRNGFYLGINSNIPYGPTSETGYYAGYPPVLGGYTIYRYKANEGPSIYSTLNDGETINLAKTIASSLDQNPSISTISDALTWLSDQSNCIVVNQSYPNISTDGLVLLLDSGFTTSYPQGGTGWYDLSTSTKTASLQNGVSFSPNNLGSLNYVASSLQFADVPDIGTLNQFTVSVWFFLNKLPIANPGAAAIVTNVYNGSNLNFSIGLNNAPFSSNICAGFFNGAWRTTTGFTPTVGTWYNVTMTYNGTQIIQYVNGASQSTLNYTGTAVSSGQGIRVGRRWDSAPTAVDFIDGIIPHVSIYNRVLSAAEVSTNYNALVGRFGSLQTSGIILNWDLQNIYSYSGSGSTITDIVAKLNGTLTGTLTYTSGTPNYLNIEGSATEYIVTGNLNPNLSPVNTGTNLSLFMWIYPTVAGIFISEQGSLTPDSGWTDAQIQMNSSGNFLFSVWPYNFGGPALITSAKTYSLNTWYYVGWTYTGTTLTAYVDGSSVGTATVTRQTPYNNSGSSPYYYYLGYPTSTNMVTTGGGPGGGPAATFRFGAMQIYNIGLTAGQVALNYSATRFPYLGSVPGSPLGLWDAFDYPGSGTNWPDSSGNGNNATFYNTPTWTGADGAYFTLDGVNEYAALPDGFSNFNRGLTVLAFVDFGAAGNWERILDLGQGQEDDNIILFRESTTNNLGFQIYNGTSLNLALTLTNGISNNAWGFYGARVDGSTTKIFNATTSNSGSSTVLPSNVVRNRNYLGRSNWASDAYFQRYFGVIAIYDTALNDTQITQFYNYFRGRYGI